MADKTSTHLIGLEKQLYAPRVRKSAVALAALLDDDFFEYAKDGKKYTKQQILKLLPLQPTRFFKLSRFQVTSVSATVRLVNYLLEETKTEGRISSLRTSLWKKTGKTWRMVFHQATGLEAA